MQKRVSHWACFILSSLILQMIAIHFTWGVGCRYKAMASVKVNASGVDVSENGYFILIPLATYGPVEPSSFLSFACCAATHQFSLFSDQNRLK